MLGKLLKYDFRSMFRVFLPLWGALLAISFINRLTLNSNSMGIPGLVLFIAYIGIIFAVMAVTLVLVVQRFYNGLLKSEGYLMFTLPVKPWQLIASKGITAMVVTVLSVFMAGLSVLIIAQQSMNIPPLSEWIKGLRGIGADGVLMLALVVLLILTSALVSVTHIHASLALGHLANSHRIAWAVGAYVGINMLLTTIVGIAARTLGRYNFRLELDHLEAIPLTNIVLFALNVLNIIQIAIFFVTTERILTKRLNLE